MVVVLASSVEVIVIGAVSSEIMAFTSSSRDCFWLERDNRSLRLAVRRSVVAAAGDMMIVVLLFYMVKLATQAGCIRFGPIGIGIDCIAHRMCSMSFDLFALRFACGLPNHVMSHCFLI